MEEYKYDEESVNALVKWAETATFPEQVMLSDAENIFDVKRYVRANLSDIAAKMIFIRRFIFGKPCVSVDTVCTVSGFNAANAFVKQ